MPPPFIRTLETIVVAKGNDMQGMPLWEQWRRLRLEAKKLLDYFPKLKRPDVETELVTFDDHCPEYQGVAVSHHTPCQSPFGVFSLEQPESNDA
jgi:hypothetical protein